MFITLLGEKMIIKAMLRKWVQTAVLMFTITLLLFSAVKDAGAASVSQAGVLFLKISPGARPGGMGVGVVEFFELSAGLYATKVLSDLGILDSVKERYESHYGPIPVYDISQLEGGEPNDQGEAVIDPLLKQIKKDIEEGENLPEDGELGDE